MQVDLGLGMRDECGNQRDEMRKDEGNNLFDTRQPQTSIDTSICASGSLEILELEPFTDNLLRHSRPPLKLFSASWKRVCSSASYADWNLKDMSTEWKTVAACVTLALLLRWGVALFPYSGEGLPPKYGDFEAHRHWMEITTNVPLSKWYYNSSVNNLDYWGLDYPPLSAFHSFGMGKIFKKVLPEAVKIKSSRGFESPKLKFLMRLSVVASDLLIPALVAFHLKYSNPRRRFATWVTVLLPLAAPPFIMVDYGHFQYNCVSLGLTVWAIVALFSEQISIASILFTLAVHHKQMSLYHSLTFAAYMLGTVVIKRADVLTAFRVGSVIASTVGMMWLPFGDYAKFVFQRIFPLKRGVFEDKVGTFWYILDRFIPLKGTYPDQAVAELCGISTILFLLPSTFHLFCRACSLKVQTEIIRKNFLIHMFNASIVCFLFSYHVHEKTIMLPALAAVLLFPSFPIASVWFISVASLSMYPLFYEEKSHVALLCTVTFFILIAQQGKVFDPVKSIWMKLVFLGSLGGYAGLIGGLHFITPPGKLPHLFQSGIAIYSFIHFACFCVYFHWVQFPLGHIQPTARGKVAAKKAAKKKQ